ncbi:exopolysaccharide biosynthesis polyprenyl glycosylphosphotransferase [Aureivirga sp. CE67]|uniref:exopolysaccharide biosynthesis polyprenyl glycosylphosphotransferase n=1 Tax=Aureivirga sp. CE67 TaxID=1788983 RepID=UPI0018CA03C3|nr:exopolysaccharide biosynthesis polyprenyl glycosylphosphotransferase [Aureivirga sp. CE67]
MLSNLHFSISERRFFLRLFDVLFVILFQIFLIESELFDYKYFNIINENFYYWIATFVIYLLFFSEVFEMYNLKAQNDNYLVTRGVLLTSIFTTSFYILTPILSPSLPENRIQIIYLFFSVLSALLIWRFSYRFLIVSPRFQRRILLIGSTKSNLKTSKLIEVDGVDSIILGQFSFEKSKNQSDIKWFDFRKKNIQELIQELNISEVIVSNYDNESFEKIIDPQLAKVLLSGVRVTSFESFYEKLSLKIPMERFDSTFYNYISYNETKKDGLYEAFVRTIDVFAGILGLSFLACIIPFVTIINFFTNRGSLFYYQERIGKKGKPFRILKLRSMVTNAEKDGAVWASKNDTRITKFGKILRKTRLDEIPQFYNVLIGDMSLIGPRPERPQFVDELEKDLPFYALRHMIKPGLTGWSQVLFPYASTYEQQKIKLRYDLYYIRERSILMDFKIIIKTISTVVFMRGN